MNSEYFSKLEKQKSNSLLPAQRIYYADLYNRIQKSIFGTNEILEIGCGAGISKNFLQNLKINRTDYLNWDKHSEITGNIDAENLPYEDSTFDVIFGVDMIHHVNNPTKVLKEAIRVSKKGGKIVFVEPYVSPVSYLVYRIFHDENTTYRYKLSKRNDCKNPQDGDQGVAKSLFTSGKGITLLRHLDVSEDQLSIDLMHPFSFFATGGLSRPLKIHPFIIQMLLRIENYIPQQLMKVIASRIMITIEIIK